MPRRCAAPCAAVGVLDITGRPSRLSKRSVSSASLTRRRTTAARMQWDGYLHPQLSNLPQWRCHQRPEPRGASTMKITTVGIDLAKNVLQVHVIHEVREPYRAQKKIPCRNSWRLRWIVSRRWSTGQPLPKAFALSSRNANPDLPLAVSLQLWLGWEGGRRFRFASPTARTGGCGRVTSGCSGAVRRYIAA